ncbi:MAG: hypothetical protein JKX95_04730 [Bacteroidia bacterium]|nr:hypothetical protein [Bacteroidia bacterium]
MKQRLLVQLFVIYTRYLIGGAFVFSSVIKIQGKRFTADSGADHPIDTAWHFFETLYQSGIYWKFLGGAQLVAGLLLMTQRYSKLGALLFLPIITSIFMVTISYEFAGTPIITGLMLLANLMLIYWDWDELRILINKKPFIDDQKRWNKDTVWEITGIALFAFTVICRVLAYHIFLWFGVCCLIGTIGLILGLKRKNNYN